MELVPYTVVVRKDLSGFYQDNSIGSLSMIFLGICPQDTTLACVATTREDVVGDHGGVPIVKLPFSTITFEKLENLMEAPVDVLLKLGILQKEESRITSGVIGTTTGCSTRPECGYHYDTPDESGCDEGDFCEERGG